MQKAYFYLVEECRFEKAIIIHKQNKRICLQIIINIVLLGFIKDKELAHDEIEGAGETQTQQVTDNRLETGILEPVKGDKQEVESLHGGELDEVCPHTGRIVGGEVAPERAHGALRDALLPYEEVCDDEVDHGGHLKGYGGRHPETAPIVPLEHKGTQYPVQAKVNYGSRHGCEREHD